MLIRIKACLCSQSKIRSMVFFMVSSDWINHNIMKILNIYCYFTIEWEKLFFVVIE